MTGDSSVAMARVFYVDALSLRRVNDAATFSRMLSTMQADQSRNTWMAERYTCEGLASHDPFYHEYPEVIAMVLQKVKYGITVLLDRVEVLPWIALFPAAGKPGAAGADGSRAHRGPLASSLRYQLSGMLVEYMVEDSDEGSSIKVVIQMRRLSGTKRFRVGGFEPAQMVQLRGRAQGAAAAVQGGGGDALDGAGKEERTELMTVDEDGIAQFEAATGPGWELVLQTVPSSEK
jgi:hypothetical protein